MPTQAGELVDRVLQRVRDEHATGNSREFVRRVLTHCQRLLNAKLGLVIASVEFPTVAYQQVYPIASLAASALRVVGVQQANRDLVEVKWQEFGYVRRQWPRDVGSRLENFALIGRDLLVLYPSQTANASVTLRCAALTADLAADLTDVQVPDEFHPLLTDLASAVVLTKMRTYLTLDELSKSIEGRLGA